MAVEKEKLVREEEKRPPTLVKQEIPPSPRSVIVSIALIALI